MHYTFWILPKLFHLPFKLFHRPICISVFLTNTSPESSASFLFVLPFCFNWVVDLLWKYFLHWKYYKCLLCVYSRPHYHKAKCWRCFLLEHRVSSRPIKSSFSLDWTKYSSFHATQWPPIPHHEDPHPTLDHFPSFTEKFSTLTIVLPSSANSGIWGDFSIHIENSPYTRHFKDAT